MIQPHVVHDDRTAPYAAYAYSSLISLAARPQDILPVNAVRCGAGSLGHAAAVESVFSSADPSVINLLFDSDTVVLVNGWDDYVREQLGSFCNMDAFGASFEPVGGRCVQPGRQMYTKHPTVTWMAWRNGCMRNLSLAPQLNVPLLISSTEESELYGLPPGYELLRDTGWQVPSYCRDNGLRTSVLTNTRLQDFPGCRRCDASNELFLTRHSATPFMAHQRSSRNVPFMSGKSKRFYDACSMPMLEAQEKKT